MVRRTPDPVRSNSSVPSVSSRLLMRDVTAGWVRCNTSAAPLMLPTRTTVKNVLSCSSLSCGMAKSQMCREVVEEAHVLRCRRVRETRLASSRPSTGDHVSCRRSYPASRTLGNHFPNPPETNPRLRGPCPAEPCRVRQQEPSHPAELPWLSAAPWPDIETVPGRRATCLPRLRQGVRPEQGQRGLGRP